MHTRILTTVLISSLTAAGTARAHHSQAEFNIDPAAMETISGTVTRFDFRNPHVYLYLETEEADGSTAVWQLEASSTPNLIRRGWTADSVEPGEAVAIDIHPAKVPGQHIARLNAIHFADGRMLAARGEERGTARDPNARARSLAGRWLGRNGLGQVEWDLDQWPLTAQGHAAEEAYDGTQNPQTECIPATAPTIMLYSTVFDVDLNADRMLVNAEWMSVERVIYLDGRAHLPADETSLQGHSIGHWEGDTLVIDTTSFEAHGAGLAFEVPSGVDKHLVERLTLSDDGKRVDYEFMIEDPEYLTAPVTGSGTWDYRPDLTPQRVDCDPEVARRFTERK